VNGRTEHLNLSPFRRASHTWLPSLTVCPPCGKRWGRTRSWGSTIYYCVCSLRSTNLIS